MSNKMQRYTVYFIWKLLYMFRVVPPPIISSANNCIYSIWYLSHRCCYLPLSWKSWNYWTLKYSLEFTEKNTVVKGNLPLCRRIVFLNGTEEHKFVFNPLNPELNPICHLLTLLAHHFLHVSRIMVKSLTLRRLMSYIYGAPILDVSRSHTTTQHSR